MRRLLPLLALLSLPLALGNRPPDLGIASLPIPGPTRFTKLARQTVDVAVAVDPSLASNAGIFEDAVRVPKLGPEAVAAQVARAKDLQRALRRLPWRSWDEEVQVDVRYSYAVLEGVRRTLEVEKLYLRRPGAWLEPTANNLLALATYAPERPQLQDAVLDLIPAMLQESRAVLATPTRRDVHTAVGLVDSLASFAKTRNNARVEQALAAYRTWLEGLNPAKDFDVVGREAYAGRMRDVLLLPWTPEELRTKAEAEIVTLDARLQPLPTWQAPEPTEALLAAARGMTKESMLALYDTIEEKNRAATIAGGWVTIPDVVGPVRARETPDALLPLTGDGGSMNPPPTYVDTNVGWWNVQHFQPTWTEAERVQIVQDAWGWLDNGMGPYAAHEGFPGHHLQLAIARLQPDPLRSILPDPVGNEGWALYAERVFWEHGGLGKTPTAEAAIFRSYRHRARRVVYDSRIETGDWTLQEGADYKYYAAPGQGAIDEELMRSINWPTQLICYYAGNAQIVEMREAWVKKHGPDLRPFHDALLAQGSIPYALSRAALLDEPIPDFPPETP